MRIAIALVFAAGCFDAGLSDHPRCGPGDACPDGLSCLSGVCVTTGCGDKADGDACVQGNIGDGTCLQSTCVPRGCGDGVVQDGEVCDDGNHTPGDGCSATCDSKETCGNDVVDFSVGEQCDGGVAGLSGDGCTSTCTIEFAAWVDATPKAIDRRFGAAIAFDGARHHMTLFGGTGAGTQSDTWVLDDDAWVQQFPNHIPPQRRLAAMAFDAVRGTIVMFGGDSPGGELGDTWLFDGFDWTFVDPATKPPARAEAAVAFDPTHGRVVIFGGQAGATRLADTWAWNGTTWSQLGDGPPARIDAALGLDPSTGKLVLFGGNGAAGALADTWVLDGATWTQIATTPAQTPPAGDSCMLYADGNQLVFARVDQTWGFAQTGWTQIEANIAPPRVPARFLFATAFDPEQHREVLFGGGGDGPFSLADTWTLAAPNAAAWVERAIFAQPPARSNAGHAFDAGRSRLVVFGGLDTNGVSLADTWVFDAASWRQITGPSPEPRSASVMTYDPVHDRVLLFGGFDGATRFSDTWTFDGAAWTELAPATSPPPISDFVTTAALTFDTRRGLGVLFDGVDTWTWDGANWTKLTTAHAPTPRFQHAMVYDEGADRIVLFGGENATTGVRIDDTWVFENDDWSQVTTVGGPSARTDHRLVYDRPGHRVLLVAGFELGRFLDDLWAFDGTTWTQIKTSQRPPIRARAATAFDAARDRVVTFGGRSLAGTLGDTWSFSVTGLERTETCSADFDADGDGLVGCADPDCAGFCTPSCSAYTDRYDHRPGAPACTLAGPFCGDGTCQPPRENHARCPMDCP